MEADVVCPEGSLYVAVPDASTFSDRLFRWIYREESGHVNPFRSADALASDIARTTGLKLSAVRPLYSSFEYLNRYYFGARTSWRLRLIGDGNRRAIVALSYAARLFDRVFRTRAKQVDTDARSNVWVGCGARHAVPWLMRTAWCATIFCSFDLVFALAAGPGTS